MRKLQLQVQLSVDGFIAGENGEMDWMEWNWSEDIKSYVGSITEPIETVLLGRKLAEGFIPYWEDAATKEPKVEGADKFSVVHKVVFTKTLKTHDWKNTDLATGDLVEEVNKLKSKEGGTLMAYGGGSFVTSLIKAGLVDEFHLLVNPTALGKGMPIFQGLEAMQQFKLLEAKGFGCGITLLHYTKA